MRHVPTGWNVPQGYSIDHFPAPVRFTTTATGWVPVAVEIVRIDRHSGTRAPGGDKQEQVIDVDAAVKREIRDRQHRTGQ